MTRRLSVERSHNRRTLRAAAALILLVTGPADAAESQEICADRPGKASAPCTAPAGHVQIETGLADWSLQRSRRVRESLLELGATAIKYGVGDRTHVEVDVTPLVRDSLRENGMHQTARGVGDTQLRVKQRLTPDHASVEVALYPFVKLPTASHKLGNGKLEAGLAVPIQTEVANGDLSLALTPEIDWLADEDRHGHHAALVQVAALGWPISDAVTLSGELWGQWDWDPAGTTRQASADLAAAYLPREDLQLDAGVNVGLNANTPDVELYVGLAKRF